MAKIVRWDARKSMQIVLIKVSNVFARHILEKNKNHQATRSTWKV